MNRGAIIVCCFFTLLSAAGMAPVSNPDPKSWSERGFADFRDGAFEDAGNDLYVSAAGVIQRIHRYDIDNDGSVDLSVCNTHDTNDRIDTSVYWGGADGLRADRKAEFHASGSHSAAVGDVNRDGHSDLVLASYYDGDTYQQNSNIYLGTSSGLDSKKRVDIPTLAARDVVVADFNRDGYPDIFFAVPWRDGHWEAEETEAPLFWGAADGFSPSRRSSLHCRGSVAAVAADLDGNGYPDIVLANVRGTRSPKTNSFIYWNGSEGMSRERRTELPTDGSTDVAVGDVNGDGRPDVLFASSTGAATTIFLNDSKGFSSDRAMSLAQPSSGVALADLDGDGDLDAVLAFQDSVSIYSNQKGIFASEPSSRLPASDAVHLSAADLNRDGLPELIVSNNSSNFVYSCNSFVYKNDKGRFSASSRAELPTHGATHSVVGDLNGDGYPDVVFSNAQTGHTGNSPIDSFVYHGDAQGRFSPGRKTKLSTIEVTDVVSADFDGNGYPDIAFAGDGRRLGSKIEGSFLYSNGPKGFDPRPMNFPVLGARGVETADLNRDGYLDIILSNPFAKSEPEYPVHSTFIFWGSAQGYDSSRFHTFSTPDAYRFSLADFDRDGYLDLVVGRMYKDCLSIYWGNASGKFSADDRLDLPTFLCNNVNVADMDGDGNLDLVVGNKGSRDTAEEPAMIYWGAPAQEARSRQEIFSTERRTDLPSIGGSRTCVADFDNDGRLDLCITNYLGNNNRQVPSYIYWGDGKRFASKKRTEIPFEAGSGALSADFDRDGWLDLAIASHKAGSNHATMSKVFWGHKKGFLALPPTELPTVGAHQFQNRNIGNIATRGPGVAYVSSVHAYTGGLAELTWRGETPGRTTLTFQVRAAGTREGLGTVQWSRPMNGKAIDLSALQVPPQGFIQYRVDFISPDGGLSPSLSEVTIRFK